MRTPWIIGSLLVIGIVIFCVVGGLQFFRQFAQESSTRTQRILGKEEDRQFRMLVELSERQVASNLDNWGADLRALATAPRLRAYVEALANAEKQAQGEQAQGEQAQGEQAQGEQAQEIATDLLSSEEAAKEFLRANFLQEMLIVNVEGKVVFVASGNEALVGVDFREGGEDSEGDESSQGNESSEGNEGNEGNEVDGGSEAEEAVSFESEPSLSLRQVVGDATGDLLEGLYRRAVLFAVEQGSPLLPGEAAAKIDSGTQLFFASHTRSSTTIEPDTPFAFYALPMLSAERTLTGTLLLFQSREQMFEKLLLRSGYVGELHRKQLFFIDPRGTIQLLGEGKKFTEIRAWLRQAFVRSQSLGATAIEGEQGSEQHRFIYFRSFNLLDEQWILVVAEAEHISVGKGEAQAEPAAPPDLPPQATFLSRLAIAVVLAFSLLCLFAGQLLVTKQDGRRRGFGLLLASLIPFQRGERNLPYLERDDHLGEYARMLKGLVERARGARGLSEARSDTRRMDEERSRRLEGLVIDFQEKVQGATGGLAGATGNLVQTSDEMRRQAGQAREATQEMLPRVANTTQRVRGAAEEIARLTQALDTINRRAQESTLVIRQSVTSTEKADRSAKLLASASDSIGSVVQLIQDIAGQVNLLSLNATIESARAGEAGKGFAVVAAEVKNLADQTTKATERISGLIENLQTSSAEVLQVLDEIRTTVRNAETVVAGISETMQQQRQTGEAVARSMLEAANNVATIQTSFTTVDTASAGADKSAIELSQSVDHLRSQASALEQHIRVFMGDIQKA